MQRHEVLLTPFSFCSVLQNWAHETLV